MENKKIGSCRLHLPEGLTELMSDISREVLRAQPADIYGFIADYLSALLVTRDNLSIASQVCDYICDCECHPELYDELLNIGIEETEAKIVQSVIMKHFEKEKVNEGNLLASLLAKTNIEARTYPAIVNSTRTAYLRHQGNHQTKYEMSPKKENDEVSKAVSHTLELYRQVGPTDELYGEMATKIQASYRAYGVRRALRSNNKNSNALSDPDSDNYAAYTCSNSSTSADFKEEIEVTARASTGKRRVSTASEISLAGSIYCLRDSYDAHDIECLSLVEETEKMHSCVDYTARSPRVSMTSHDGRRLSSNVNRRISFKNDAKEEMYSGQTATELYDTSKVVTTRRKSQEDGEYDNESTEGTDKSVSEEVVELDELKYEEDDEMNGINVLHLEVDTDSGDDDDVQ